METTIYLATGRGLTAIASSDGNWRGLISFKQQRALLKDVFRGLFLVPFHGTKLRENMLVRMKFSSREMRLAGKNSGATTG